MDLLREKLNKIDHYCIDNDKHFYDLRSLYEALSPFFTPRDKMELKKVINATNDPAVIQATLQQLQNESYDPEEDYYDDDMYRDRDEDDMYDDWQMGNVGRFNKYPDGLLDEPLPFESLQEAGNYDTGKLNTRINKLKSGIRDIKADWKAGKTKYKKKSSEDEDDARDAKRYRAMMAAQKGDINQSNQKKESFLKEGTMSQDELINAIQNGKSFDFNDYKDYFGTNEPYVELDSKSVKDSDGFLTDYTLYYDYDLGEFVCIFGDKELYTPDNSEPDAEFETEREAREWFDDYNGFENESFDDIWESLKQINESQLSEDSITDRNNAALGVAIGNSSSKTSKSVGGIDRAADALVSNERKKQAQLNQNDADAQANSLPMQNFNRKGRGYDPDANPNGIKRGTNWDPDSNPNGQNKQVGQGTVNQQNKQKISSNNSTATTQTAQKPVQQEQPVQQQPQQQQEQQPAEQPQQQEAPKGPGAGSPNYTELAASGKTNVIGFDQTQNGFGRYKTPNNESLTESAQKWTATDIVRDLYNKYPEVDFLDERDVSDDKVALFFKFGGDVTGLEDLVKSYGCDYRISNGKLRIIADEDDEYMDESYKDTLGAAGSAIGKTAAGFFDGPSPVLDLAGGVVGGAIGKTVGGLLDKKNSKNEQLNEDAFDSMTIKSGTVDIHDTFTLDEFDEDDGWFEFEVYPGTYEYRVLDVNGWKPRQIKIDGEWIDVNDKCKN